MAAESRTTLKAYFQTGDTPTQAQFANLIDSFYSLVSDFQLLFGTIDQSGTSAPTVNVMFNSLGFTPTYNYLGVGSYTIESTGNLDDAKVIFFISTGQASRYTPVIYVDSSPDTFALETFDNSFANANGLLDKNAFLILKIP